MDKDFFLIFTVKFLLHFKLYSIIENLIPLKKGLSFQQLTMILFFYQISKWIFEVPTGIVADKCGRKYSCIISVLFSEIFLILLLYFKSFILIFVAFIFNGLAYSFMTGSIDALLTDTVIKKGLKENLDKYNIIERIIFYTSIGFSTIIGGKVAVVSYSYVILMSAIINIFSLIFIFFLNETIEIKKRNTLDLKSIKLFFEDKKILLIFIIDIFIAFSMVPIDSYYTIFFKKMGFLENIIGIIKASQFIFSSIIILSLRKNSISFKNFIYLPIVMLVSFFIFSIVKDLKLSLFFYTFGLFIFCLYAPQKYKEIHSNINSNIRGTIISITALFISLSGSFSHFIFILISEKISLNTFFSLILGISIFLTSTSVLYIKFKDEKR